MEKTVKNVFIEFIMNINTEIYRKFMYLFESDYSLQCNAN